MSRIAALLVILAAASSAQDEAVPLREQAAALVAVGKYAEAEPILLRALESEPALEPAIEELAAVYRAQGKNKDAEKLYLR